MSTKTLPAKKSPAVPAEKHAGGRPTKFKPEYADALIKFFDIEPYKREVIESMEETFKDGTHKKTSKKFKLMPTKMPTLYRFARSIKVEYRTVRRWAEKGELLEEDLPEKLVDKPADSEEVIAMKDALIKFCHAYNEAKELQKEHIISNGMAGSSPPAFAIFTAKNVTDMRDRIERTDTVNHQVFFVPRAIAEKHGLQLPEDDQPAPHPLPASDVKVLATSDPAADPV